MENTEAISIVTGLVKRLVCGLNWLGFCRIMVEHTAPNRFNLYNIFNTLYIISLMIFRGQRTVVTVQKQFY